MRYQFAITCLILAAMLGLSNAAGFGEVASTSACGGGCFYYNISVNSSQAQTWYLVNNYTYPVSFTIVPPNFGDTPTGMIVEFSTLKGTIPAATNTSPTYYPINITIYMPLNASLNQTWRSYATAYLVLNATGVSINQGTSKYIDVVASPTTSTTSSTTTALPTPPSTELPVNTTTTPLSVKHQSSMVPIAVALSLIALISIGTVVGINYHRQQVEIEKQKKLEAERLKQAKKKKQGKK